MKIYYEEPIARRIIAAAKEADTTNKKIDYIELTREEATELVAFTVAAIYTACEETNRAAAMKRGSGVFYGVTCKWPVE